MLLTIGIVDLPLFERPFTLIGDHFVHGRSRSRKQDKKDKQELDQHVINNQQDPNATSSSSSIINLSRRSFNTISSFSIRNSSQPSYQPSYQASYQSKYNNPDLIKESHKESPDKSFNVVSSITNITKESMDMISSSIDELIEPLFFQSAKRIPKKDPKQDLQHDENESNLDNHVNHRHDYHHSGEDFKQGHHEGHEDHQEGFLKHSGVHLPSMHNLLFHKKKNYTVYNVLIGSSCIKGVIVMTVIIYMIIVLIMGSIILVMLIIMTIRLAKMMLLCLFYFLLYRNSENTSRK